MSNRRELLLAAVGGWLLGGPRRGIAAMPAIEAAAGEPLEALAGKRPLTRRYAGKS